MTQEGRGGHYRKGLTIMQLLHMFPDDATAERWFEERRWPDGRYCPDCGSLNTAVCKDRKPMPYRCRDCRGHFSVRKGTSMQSSKIGLREWIVGLFLMSTNIKGTASMKVYRDLGIRQGTAWFIMQRIREGFEKGVGMPLPRPVKASEPRIGGKEKNKRSKKILRAGRGSVGRSIVADAKNRATNEIRAKVVKDADAKTVQKFVECHTDPDVSVYTDEDRACTSIDREHETVNYSVDEHVRDDVHTQGMDSFWSMLGRARKRTFHKLSHKHPGRNVREFEGRHRIRDLDYTDMMTLPAPRMVGKRLCFRDMIADNGLPPGARA